MNHFAECATINDMKAVICKHAKKEGMHVGEIWIDDYWLCYVIWERVDDESHRKEKLRYFEEKSGRKLEHTGTSMHQSSKWKDHKGKINLCKYIDPRKSKEKQIKKKIKYETGERPNW